MLAGQPAPSSTTPTCADSVALVNKGSASPTDAGTLPTQPIIEVDSRRADESTADWPTACDAGDKFLSDVGLSHVSVVKCVSENSIGDPCARPARLLPGQDPTQ